MKDSDESVSSNPDLSIHQLCLVSRPLANATYARQHFPSLALPHSLKAAVAV